MCNYEFCEICKPDFSQPVGHFTWVIPPPPKNYNVMIRNAAVGYERWRSRYQDIDKYWPPRKYGAEESILLAAREFGVCPNDLAFYVNNDHYRNEQLAKEDAELQRR